jgi:D-beta-D-heptose 7-phosphate kinase/D-beta-D-heptose 1-phosphate adenosyltransferase
MGEIWTVQQAAAWSRLVRDAGATVVLTNGHFDLLHVGHLDYLEKAQALGDALIVGVNGDASTRHLKGPGRPLIPALERARLLSALAPVTACVIFEDETAIGLVEALQPTVYVKGGDYAAQPGADGKFLPERAAVEACGGRVVLIDYLPDHSTSALIARVRALPNSAT